MKKTLFYIKSKKQGDICYKCFDKEETQKYMESEHLDDKDYEFGEVEVNLDEFFKIRATQMPNYLNKLIRSK